MPLNGRYVLYTASEVQSLLVAKKIIQYGKKAVHVGYSYGGFVAQAYAFQYPSYVSGLVLVEPVYPQWLEDNPDLAGAIEAGKKVITVVKAISPLGVLRLAGLLQAIPTQFGYPASDFVISRNYTTAIKSLFLTQKHFLDAFHFELSDHVDDFNKTTALFYKDVYEKPLNRIPIVHLIAEKNPNKDTQIERIEQLSAKVENVVAHGLDHYIPFRNPKLVADAVEKLYKTI